MGRHGLGVVLALLLLLVQPMLTLAAEVLQVREATLLQVGDRNRNYSIRLACIEVSPDDQQLAIDWLRQALPRRRRVLQRIHFRSSSQTVAHAKTPRGRRRSNGKRRNRCR